MTREEFKKASELLEDITALKKLRDSLKDKASPVDNPKETGSFNKANLYYSKKGTDYLLGQLKTDIEGLEASFRDI